MTVVNPATHRLVFAKDLNRDNNEVAWFSDVQAIMLNLLMPGSCIPSPTAPADTTAIWYQPSATNAANGIYKVYLSAAWQVVNAARFATWLNERAGVSGGSTTYATLGVIPDSSLPLRLRNYGEPITDWNSAYTDGNYRSAAGAANTPEGAGASIGYWYGRMDNYDAFYAHQHASQVDADTSAANTNNWERVKQNNIWGPWYRSRLSLVEIQALAGGGSAAAGVAVGAMRMAFSLIGLAAMGTFVGGASLYDTNDTPLGLAGTWQNLGSPFGSTSVAGDKIASLWTRIS
jgi:hypothetical protein